ncbi:MAG: RidA family protein [Chloroflexi bacterium]|jgi:2-iminobutanoate/2-iminopropanoate deaminase|nr:RidA family protein [Chloroflexota bacterium]
MRKQITAEKGAKAIGPYSHAIVCQGSLVFVSGQGPVNPETGKAPESFREQAIQTLTNVKTIVEAAGASMADVVKVNAYLRSMDDFAVFNEVYKTFFSEPYPARTTVQSDMLIAIEIDAIAVLPEK